MSEIPTEDAIPRPVYIQTDALCPCWGSGLSCILVVDATRIRIADRDLMDKEDIIKVLRETMNAPDEAIEAYPDECANCGADAIPFWIPDNYHELSEENRDPGICTECGHHFGTGDIQN